MRIHYHDEEVIEVPQDSLYGRESNSLNSSSVKLEDKYIDMDMQAMRDHIQFKVQESQARKGKKKEEAVEKEKS